MTRKFVVLKDFTDLEDNKHIYKAGKFYPREGTELDEARAEALASDNNAQKEPLIIEVLVKQEVPESEGQDEKEPEVEETEFPKSTGGGYYELSNGEKVRGKEAAAEAEQALNE